MMDGNGNMIGCKAAVLCIVLGFGCMVLCFFVVVVTGNQTVDEAAGNQTVAAISHNINDTDTTFSATKSLASPSTDGDGDDDGGSGGGGDYNGGSGTPTDRIGQVGVCSKDNILVYQGQTTPLPNGIPTYTVQVENTCLPELGKCSISDIHLSCGWFSSARLINPSIFRRIAYDDCLVNDGQALNPGQSLYFQYANTFSYPLAVSSVSCE